MKTNLLFFAKGGPTERVWYCDLSDVVTKKQPLTIDRFAEFFELLPTRADAEHFWTVTREELEARKLDLKAVNPKRKSTEDMRSAEELLDILETKGREIDKRSLHGDRAWLPATSHEHDRLGGPPRVWSQRRPSSRSKGET